MYDKRRWPVIKTFSFELTEFRCITKITYEYKIVIL